MFVVLKVSSITSSILPTSVVKALLDSPLAIALGCEIVTSNLFSGNTFPGRNWTYITPAGVLIKAGSFVIVSLNSSSL